jgi:hypothetical protein
MNELPDEISLIIYSYVGNNFIINKTFYNLIKRIRKNFYNNPIQLHYRVTRWKFPKNWSGERNMVNTLNAQIRPNMKVFKTETIDISNIPIGILSSDGTIYPSKFLERKILPTPLPLYEPSSIYVNTRGFSWSLYTIYSKNIDRCREYVNVRPYLGPVNTWIMNNN